MIQQNSDKMAVQYPQHYILTKAVLPYCKMGLCLIWLRQLSDHQWLAIFLKLKLLYVTL